MILRRNNEPARLETALEVRCRVKRQRMFRHQLAQKFPPDDGVAHDCFGVENVALGFDHKPAFGLEVAGDGVGDVVIAQVNVAAAALAHGGLGADGHLKCRAALETNQLAEFFRPLGRPGGGLGDFLNANVLAALFADCGDGGARFRLLLPLILPRTTTLVALMWPLTMALSPRFNVPSVWISPSSLPSNVSSPENLRLPLSSTSEFKTFFEALGGVFIRMLVVTFYAGF